MSKSHEEYLKDKECRQSLKQIDFTIDWEYQETLNRLKEKEIEDTKEYLNPPRSTNGIRRLKCLRLDELDEIIK